MKKSKKIVEQYKSQGWKEHITLIPGAESEAILFKNGKIVKIPRQDLNLNFIYKFIRSPLLQHALKDIKIKTKRGEFSIVLMPENSILKIYKNGIATLERKYLPEDMLEKGLSECLGIDLNDIREKVNNALLKNEKTKHYYISDISVENIAIDLENKRIFIFDYFIFYKDEKLKEVLLTLKTLERIDDPKTEERIEDLFKKLENIDIDENNIIDLIFALFNQNNYNYMYKNDLKKEKKRKRTF